MPDDEPLISDPKRLRALSHPLRWKLLTLIDSEHTATATRCAEILGESVASCSYHLNMLAKYDFIEEAHGGQGREKPWRLTTRNQSFTAEGLGEEGQLAAEAAGEAFLDNEFTTMKDRIRRRGLEPEQWRARATGFSSTTVYLTAEEAAAIRDEVMKLIEKHDNRWDDPAARPAGARQVRFCLGQTVAPEHPKG